jgi:hypothetical protein
MTIELTHVRRDNDLLRAVFQAEKDALEARKFRELNRDTALRAHESAALKSLVNHIGEVSALPVSYERLDSHLKALRGM